MRRSRPLLMLYGALLATMATGGTALAASTHQAPPTSHKNATDASRLTDGCLPLALPSDSLYTIRPQYVHPAACIRGGMVTLVGTLNGGGPGNDLQFATVLPRAFRPKAEVAADWYLGDPGLIVNPDGTVVIGSSAIPCWIGITYQTANEGRSFY